MDSTGAANFGYVLGGYLSIDMRLQFGWRGSPSWWWMIASVIQQAQPQTKKSWVMVLVAARAATACVHVAAQTGVAVEPLPWDRIAKGVGGRGGGPRMGGCLHRWPDIGGGAVYKDGGKRLTTPQALSSNHHHRTMGERAEGG